MTDANIETAKFGSALPAQQHVCGPPISLPANPMLDRHPQAERTCKLCGAVKVTVFPPEGGGFRMWRRAGSTEQGLNEPSCTPIGT
jgi:hypothetical protein